MNTPVAWMRSIRGRLTLAVTMLFAVVMFFGSWFLLTRAEDAWIEDLRAQDLGELETLATDLQSFDAAVFGSGPNPMILPVGIDGTMFSLVDDSGLLVATTPAGLFGGDVIVEGFSSLDPGSSELAIDALTGFALGGGNVVTVSLPVDLQQGTLTLVASSSLAPVDAGLEAMRRTLLLLIPFLVGTVAVLAWFTTGRAFRPVAAITNQVDRIGDDRLDERIPVPNSHDEVAHLARTMNTMLDRLSAGRRRQREFVSDASHELRNPVAASKAQLEVGLTNPTDTDWEATARIVLQEQDRLGDLVDDLLLLARLDEGLPPTSDDVDLDDIVFIEAARPGRVPIDVSDVEAVRVQGEARQLTHLVRNLIDNAVRHAASNVVVTLENTDDEAILTVEDDGPGIADVDRARVLERFVRLDNSRTRAEGGTGLGLAIVAGVAQTHGGNVSITEGTLGGARVIVRL